MFQHVDMVLTFATLAVAAMGVLMVYSATRGKLELAGVDPRYYLKKQLVYAIIGLAIMVGVVLIDYHQFEILGAIAYVGILLGLLAVLSPIGRSALGSQRWFQIGSFQLQPSAFATLALIPAMAAFLRRRQGNVMFQADRLHSRQTPQAIRRGRNWKWCRSLRMLARFRQQLKLQYRRPHEVALWQPGQVYPARSAICWMSPRAFRSAAS